MCGRDKQLNWCNISTSKFEETYAASSYRPAFEYSAISNGDTWLLPIDLQIDLSDVCNGACVMCHPNLSTRLRADYIKLAKVDDELGEAVVAPRAIPWVEDPVIFEKFVASLIALPNIKYLHLLGGETLVLDSFYEICERLIAADKAKDIILGLTTNCTVWNEKLIPLLTQFKSVHLGLSIESVNPINDYIRYPATITEVKSTISNFLKLRETFPELFISLRITPTLFTIYYLDEVFQYMLDNDLTAESCNILVNPEWLKCELLPENLRKEAISKLYAVAAKNGLVKGNLTVNTRDPHQMRNVQANVLYEYISFLETYAPPENVEQLRHKLAQKLEVFELVRGNCIADYAPEFVPFLTSYGYKYSN